MSLVANSCAPTPPPPPLPELTEEDELVWATGMTFSLRDLTARVPDDDASDEVLAEEELADTVEIFDSTPSLPVLVPLLAVVMVVLGLPLLLLVVLPRLLLMIACAFSAAFS